MRSFKQRLQMRYLGVTEKGLRIFWASAVIAVAALGAFIISKAM